MSVQFIHSHFQPIASWLAAACLMLACAASTVGSAWAQTASPYRPATKAVVEQRPRWENLSSARREALQPLEREWRHLDSDRKQKWLVIADKFPTLSAAEKARIQGRMSEWAKLSPEERGVTRQQFQAAKRAAPQDRSSQWQAYQALPVDEKRQLAARASPPAASAVDRTRRAVAADRGERSGSTQMKTNIVPNPAYAAPPMPVNSMALQAQPGATTTSIAKRPTPPAHQQTGLPKIAASPGFVDKSTLLPKRGPQGAATRSAAASEPTRSQ